MQELEKKILDPCCGSKMFWFDRNNPNVLFADKRTVETTLCDGRTLVIEPDMIIDFRNMPFFDDTFNLVVFDPPHLIHAGEELCSGICVLHEWYGHFVTRIQRGCGVDAHSNAL